MPEFTPDQIDMRIMSDPEMKQLAQDDPTEFTAQHEKLYHAFGYRPDGSPLPAAQQAFGKVSRATGIPEGVVQGVAAVPLPLLGTTAGIAAGSSGGPAGLLAGAVGGSILGEAGNSLLGITDPMTPGDIGVAGVGALGGALLSKAGPAAIAVGKRLIPGVGAGLNELAGERLLSKLNSMRVTQKDVEAARGAIGGIPDFKIDVPLTRELFQRESKDIARQSVMNVPDTNAYLKDLSAQIVNLGTTGKMSFKDLMTLEQGFNRIKGGRPDEVWAKASGTIIDDMEAQFANPKLSAATKSKVGAGLTAFKAFIATNRKYHADENLTQIFKSVVKETPGDSTTVLFDQKAFKTQLKNNVGLKNAFSPAEIESIRESVSSLGYLSKPPSTGGDVLSLGKRYGAGGIAGGLVAHLTGSSAMVGAPVGMALEEVLRKAVSSDTGRRVVKYLAKEGRGKINVLELQTMLGKATAGAGAGVAGLNVPAGQNEVASPFGNQE